MDYLEVSVLCPSTNQRIKWKGQFVLSVLLQGLQVLLVSNKRWFHFYLGTEEDCGPVGW